MELVLISLQIAFLGLVIYGIYKELVKIRERLESDFNIETLTIKNINIPNENNRNE